MREAAERQLKNIRIGKKVKQKRRTAEATKGYAAIGGKSPLLENTREQAIALQIALADASEYNVYVCMRYWHPLTDEVVATLKAEGYTQVILLPLYPQYSRTTTGSSYNEFLRQCKRQRYQPAIRLIEPWYGHADYQRAIVETLRSEIKKFPNPDPAHVELLFSAHGLPQKIVDQGDPYEIQIRATFESLRATLGWPHITLCYQSRVGPLKWLQPYTEEVIRDMAARGVKQMLVYPIAFVSDHTETLYELSILYGELARKHGIEHYRVAPALNADPLLIQTLKSLVLSAPSQA